MGRGGAGIESLRAGLQKALKDPNRQIRINVVEVSRVDADASLVAEYIIQQLERRVSFRRVVRQAIQRAQRAGVEGIKIQVSGRLNGAEIARTEWTREGRVPLHTLRANVDYAYSTAQTTYGILGVKVWIFKGRSDSWPGRSNSRSQYPAPATSAPATSAVLKTARTSPRKYQRASISLPVLIFELSSADPCLVQNELNSESSIAGVCAGWPSAVTPLTLGISPCRPPSPAG